MGALEQLDTALAGRYTVDRVLGRGGMATVYLARDVKHDRRVALKVLDPELGAVLGPERFLAEIRTTANLQHPHLLPLFDSGAVDGLLFYVMPFVEGETLRHRLEREKQLPIDEAVRIAVAVASALDYAHAQGVIHRDLKPENILMQAGQPVVADFGIALAVSKAGGARITQTGISLGTPQYMSPEQATGDRLLDARTDIYSLGAITYEMLTGELPHSGTTAQAIIARLMTEEVRPLTVLRRSVPPHVDAAVRRALEKLPADRFTAAAEFALALQGKLGMAPPVVVTASSGVAPAAPRWHVQSAVAWSVAVLAVAFAATREWRGTKEAPPTPVVRTHLELAPGEQVLSGGFSLALSPLGDRIAYISQGPAGVRTYVRRSDQFTSHEITTGSPNSYAFSPDGRWLAYGDASGVLKKAPSDGGASITLGTIPAAIMGVTWRSSAELLVGSSKGLWLIASAGGAPRRLLAVDSADMAAGPRFVDDGETAVITHGRFGVGAPGLAVLSLSSGEPVDLGITGASPVGMVDGYLVYTTAERALMAVPLDGRRKKLAGESVQLMEGVVGVAVSASGALAYVSGQSNAQLVMVEPGRPEIPVMAETRRYVAPRFSPDGRKIAVAVGTPASPPNTGDIWVYDLDGRTFSQVSTDGPVNGVPEWSPDGKRVLYRHSGTTGRTIWWRPVDGSAPAEQMERTNESVNEALISPDGKWFVYRTAPGGPRGRAIFGVPLTGELRPLLSLAAGPAVAAMPSISPDGRWLAYQSDESGRFEIYVRPFPNPGTRIRVSTDGGSEPLWTRNGKALVYRVGQSVVSVGVSTSPTFTIVERRTLLSGNYLTESTHQDYDISPDGTRLLMVKATEASSSPVIVHNWRRELREKLAAEKKKLRGEQSSRRQNGPDAWILQPQAPERDPRYAECVHLGA
jgi:serine/threonine-protein kinase